MSDTNRMLNAEQDKNLCIIIQHDVCKAVNTKSVRNILGI